MSAATGYGKIIGISVAAIAIAVAAILISSYSFMSQPIAPQDEEMKEYNPQTKDIYLFTMVDEHIDEEKLVIPPDQYSHDSIVAQKGDTIKIHFYNLEPVESQEHHTFTMQAPYEMHHDINADENVVIEFKATESGVFDYFCTFHQPTMRGQLIVLDN